MSRRRIQETATSTVVKALMGLSSLLIVAAANAKEPGFSQGFTRLPVIHSYSSYSQGNSHVDRSPISKRIAPQPAPYVHFTRQWNAASGFTVISSNGSGPSPVVHGMLTTRGQHAGAHFANPTVFATGVNAHKYKMQWTGIPSSLR